MDPERVTVRSVVDDRATESNGDLMRRGRLFDLGRGRIGPTEYVTDNDDGVFRFGIIRENERNTRRNLNMDDDLGRLMTVQIPAPAARQHAAFNEQSATTISDTSMNISNASPQKQQSNKPSTTPIKLSGGEELFETPASSTPKKGKQINQLDLSFDQIGTPRFAATPIVGSSKEPEGSKKKPAKETAEETPMDIVPETTPVTALVTAQVTTFADQPDVKGKDEESSTKPADDSTKPVDSSAKQADGSKKRAHVSN